MNKNRAPAQESLPLRGRCHFRGKQPMKGKEVPMTRKSPYPTRADYPALIENAKPALRELMEAASYERRIAVLNECSLDVVNTVCTIMVLGRHSLYLRRKKPFNAPDAVFARWAADLWTLREQDKAGDIRYLCGKTDLREYLSQGLQLLRIDLTEGGTYARETR